MNKLTIIGNLSRDPELRTTASGINVCNMTVAVNRRRAGNDPETDFFGVSVWRGLGESCAKYLRKGAKVCVIGAVGVRTYQTNSGETRAVMEVNADDVEFLSGRNENRQENAAPTPAGTPEGFTAVETDDLPF